VAKVFGRIRASLKDAGKPLADADLQLAATAVHHGLHLISGNMRHFERVPELTIHPVLSESRRSAPQSGTTK
jgi:predicted nucleic acid-binding protein